VITQGLKQGYNFSTEETSSVIYGKYSEIGIQIRNKTFHSLLPPDDQIIFAGQEDVGFSTGLYDEEIGS
jgi:hypothetical protein